jgi:hypothetical protein
MSLFVSDLQKILRMDNGRKRLLALRNHRMDKVELRALVVLPMLFTMAFCVWADTGHIVGHYVRTTRSPVFGADNIETGKLVISPGPHNRVLFVLDVTWAPRPNDGSLTHEGSATGELEVKNNAAVFVDADTDCLLVFQFQQKQVVITQLKRCDFGAGVDASGTYSKNGKQGPLYIR